MASALMNQRTHLIRWCDLPDLLTNKHKRALVGVMACEKLSTYSAVRPLGAKRTRLILSDQDLDVKLLLGGSFTSYY